MACSAHFPRSWVDPVLRDLAAPPSPDPRSRPCPSSPLLGARSLPGPAPWWPSFPSHLKTANVVFSAGKTGEMQIGAMNIQGRVVEWHRNFGGETARVPMPPVTSLPYLSKFPLSESLLCPLTTSQNISQKPVSLSHLNVFAVFRCSAIPRPSLSTNCVVDCCFQSCGVSALRRPIRALGGFCASQWERPTEKGTNENARGQKTEYTERSRQEACMKPMCQVQIEQNFWVGNFVICTGHDFTMRGIPSDNWCYFLCEITSSCTV